MADSSDSPAVTRAARPTRWPTAEAGRVRPVAGGVAVAATLAVAGVRVLANSPLSLPFVRPATAFDPVLLGSVLGCSLSAVALGVVADDALARVGLLAAGVFGALSAVAPPAAPSATGALLAAGVLVSAPSLRADAFERTLPIALLLAGLLVSLGVGGGVLPASLRAPGTALTLAGLACLPLFGVGRAAWAVGGLAAAAAFAVGVAAPFVSGAVVLVVVGVVGVPFALVAAGVGGVAALVADALRRGRRELALGGLLLAAAGVPATTQRGLAVLLGIALLSHAIARPTP